MGDRRRVEIVESSADKFALVGGLLPRGGCELRQQSGAAVGEHEDSILAEALTVEIVQTERARVRAFHFFFLAPILISRRANDHTTRACDLFIYSIFCQINYFRFFFG